MSIARVLAIAGSDSGGGAGIQADIKTITMLGGHAMTAVTAITAQNTLGVTRIQVLDPAIVRAQVIAVIEDLHVDAFKIGMLGSPEIADDLADALQGFDQPIVFDPVMVASSGAMLADGRTIESMMRLARIASLLTPNLPELAVLCGKGAIVPDRIDQEAIDLARVFDVPILVKGGHGLTDEVQDRLVRPDGTITRWFAPRIDTRHDHGTGCTLSSAIATGLAQGMALEDAIARARAYVRAAMLAAPGLGAGHGPMGHGLGASFQPPRAG